jgi:hypothetical protein
VPKTSRDTKKDCEKPGCPNDSCSVVLAGGDEVIEQSGDFRLWHLSGLARCPTEVRNLRQSGPPPAPASQTWHCFG